MNITLLGIIVGWVFINVAVLLNSENLFVGSVEYQTGHIIGFLIPTIGGILVINFVGQKIINRKKKIQTKID